MACMSRLGRYGRQATEDGSAAAALGYEGVHET